VKITRGFSYRTALTGYFLLLTLLLSWPTLLSPPQRMPVALILMISIIPLLFPLRGMLYGRKSSFTWAGYLSLFYFIHAVTEAGAMKEGIEMLAVGLELVASALLFFGVVFYLRSADSPL
jgi:uncharacterized membrane protein